MTLRARWMALAEFAEELGLTQEEWDDIAEGVLAAEAEDEHIHSSEEPAQ